MSPAGGADELVPVRRVHGRDGLHAELQRDRRLHDERKLDGPSQRRTAAYLHLWALLLASYAILLRFVPPRPLGHWDLGNTLIAIAVGLVVLAASIWMVYTLEILKSRHLQLLRRGRAEAEPEREEAVERALTADGRR